MSFHKASLSLALLAVGMLSTPMLADTLKKTVSFDKTLQVGDKTLAAGDYRLIVDGTDAKFEHDGKVVAEVHCNWKPVDHVSPYDAVVSDKDQLRELDFGGMKQVLEIAN